MLWIMESPEGGIQTIEKQQNTSKKRTEETIHGKDHPRNK
jgi:hypothetical protein